MTPKPEPASTTPQPETPDGAEPKPATPAAPTVAEVGGRKGPDPTRYGDWEKDGRCVDF